MNQVFANKLRTLVLGRQGEDERTEVVFDFSDVAREFPGGTVTLVHQCPGETTPHPVLLDIDYENHVATWLVCEDELHTEGYGECQFTYQFSGRAKSKVYETNIGRSLGTPGEPPEHFVEWLEQLTDLAAEVQESVEQAEQAKEDAETARDQAQTARNCYPYVNETSHHWMVWNVQTGTYVDTGILAEGADGVDGYNPLVTVSDIPGGHRVVITDIEHPHGQTFNVMDGEQGNPGTDGYNPAVTITDITGGHKVKITDKLHPSGQEFDVLNGQNGQDGSDGVSPQITITDITGGHQVKIVDADHPSGQTFNVMNGQQGQQGIQGNDGYSPAVTITETDTGHDVTITDKDHPSGQTFSVANGEPGSTEAGGVSYDPEEEYEEGTVGAELTQLKEEKVGIDQGLSNTGKYMKVGTDGKLVPDGSLMAALNGIGLDIENGALVIEPVTA